MANEKESRDRPPLEGESSRIKKLREEIQRAARTPYPVLILGERGTGKELVAHELYQSSDRKSRPYLRHNLGGLNPGTASAELFGHKRGSFSGATDNRDGMFRAADGGTLFLDEIGNTDRDLQGKLLRAVEYGEVVPVGGDKPILVSVRVIAATNVDIKELASQGEFRQDLIDRFPIRIQVPPLRECGDDCVLLANRFLRELARDKGIQEIRLSYEAVSLIRRYSWPGNVRELRNQVLKAGTWAPNGARDWEVTADHLDLKELDLVPHEIVPGVSQEQLVRQTLADVVLEGLLRSDSESVLDPFHEIEDLKFPATRHIAEQLELGLEQFLMTDAGKALLRSKPNGAILAELFNLPERTDNRKKSFARLIRNRLNRVLQQGRDALESERGATRRRGAE